MTFQSIDRVGIELEGGWVSQPATAQYHSDGSVSIPYGPAEAAITIRGEQVSAPLSTWEDVKAWLLACYPQAHNVSCGLHVHVSFKERRSYARLMDPEFFAYFTARMTTWGQRIHLPASHRFWTRLNGLNNFCRKTFIPDAQVSERRKNYRNGTRYTQLNYCFKIHGTIEARLFPVFKQATTAVSAVQELLSIYEDWLAMEPKEVVERIEDLG